MSAQEFVDSLNMRLMPERGYKWRDGRWVWFNIQLERWELPDGTPVEIR